MKRMIVARGGKRGKTSGRGGKGQTARAGNKRRPEWRDIIKKLPKLRGRGKNSNKTVVTNIQKPVPVNVFRLETYFNAGDVVSPATLVEKGVIATWSGKVPRVKILGSGELKKAVKIEGCVVSTSAKNAIEKAGGSVGVSKVTTNVEAPKPIPVVKEAKPAAKASGDKSAKKQSEAKKEVKKETKPAPKTPKTK